MQKFRQTTFKSHIKLMCCFHITMTWKAMFPNNIMLTELNHQNLNCRFLFSSCIHAALQISPVSDKMTITLPHHVLQLLVCSMYISVNRTQMESFAELISRHKALRQIYCLWYKNSTKTSIISTGSCQALSLESVLRSNVPFNRLEVQKMRRNFSAMQALLQFGGVLWSG
jgi:hypothetical protein